MEFQRALVTACVKDVGHGIRAIVGRRRLVSPLALTPNSKDAKSWLVFFNNRERR
jgi:hypothetical protein